jgi:hypothetical protein
MFTDPFNPAIQRAALRAGVRTFAQSTSAAFVLTAATGQAVTWGDVRAQMIALLLALGAAAVVGLGAAVQAYLSFVAKGVPADYVQADWTARHVAGVVADHVPAPEPAAYEQGARYVDPGV